MRVSEIFYSVQGEGVLTGVASVFVRASGCNLRCVWCDTPYASWNPEGENFSVDEIVRRVAEYSSARHVVLTGGEPMIMPEIFQLAAAFRAAGYHITIETAGTVPPAGVACDLASISPKLKNSSPGERAGTGWAKRHEETRWQPAVVSEWLALYDYQLKFVVSGPEDLEEIDAMLRQLARAPRADRILLMPEGTSLEAIRERSPWVVHECMQRGWRYCARLHIELFGNKRGT